MRFLEPGRNTSKSENSHFRFALDFQVCGALIASMNFTLRLVAIFLIWGLGISRAIGQNLPESRDLVQSANATSDLSLLRPYTLRATIVAKPGTKDETRGRITIYQAKDRSRTELEFGNYRELKIVLGTREYIASNAQAPPVVLHDMSDPLHLWQVAIASSDELGFSFVKEIEGIKANCFETKQPVIKTRSAEFARSREVVRHCFDPDKKVVVEIASTHLYQGNLDWETHYLDYHAISGVQFPGAVRHFMLGKPAGIDFEDIQLSSLNPDSVNFSVPKNALEFETCDNPSPLRMVEVVDPSYPTMAMIAHIQGDVYFSAIVGKDGVLENIKVLMGHPILVQAALDAVKQWRYSPAMCGANPIAVKTELSVRFHM